MRPAAVAAALGALAVLLYANTFQHGYVLDDDIVVRRNALVQSGVAGLPGIFAHGYLYGFNGLDYFYRPLALAGLALEAQLFGDDPRPHHVVNVVLFALCVGLLYLLLVSMLERRAPAGAEGGRASPHLVALVAALLFAVHPIHTEVVANIKSRDELLCLLFVLVMLRLLVAHADSRRPWTLAGSVIAYALAALSKETGLAAIALVPLTLWSFSASSPRRIAGITTCFAIAAGACLLLRHAVAGGALPEDRAAGVINNALAVASPGVRFTSSVAVLGRYLGLLIWPHPLSYDYSYNQVPLVDARHWRFLGALAVYGSLLIAAGFGLARRHVLSYAVLFYALMLLPVSNLLVPLGTVMGERLVFAASAGFCLAMAWLLVAATRGRVGGRARIPVLGVILGLGAAGTLARNGDWKDEAHLFTSGVRNAPHSARVWDHYATYLLGRGTARAAGDPQREVLLRGAVAGYARALDILPGYSEASYNMGVAYAALGDTAAALASYERTLRADRTHEGALDNLAGILFRAGRIAEARRMWLDLLAADPHHAGACGNLGVTYFREGETLGRAGSRSAADAAFRTAAEWFLRAHDASPGEAVYVRNLAATYARLGDEAAARRWSDALRGP